MTWVLVLVVFMWNGDTIVGAPDETFQTLSGCYLEAQTMDQDTVTIMRLPGVAATSLVCIEEHKLDRIMSGEGEGGAEP